MFDKVKELFYKNGVMIPDNRKEFNNKVTFEFFGPRNSMIHYCIWGTEANPVVNVWFGKSDSDSGGLALQASSDLYGRNKIFNIFKLHKRFIISGRRKILRNFERFIYG